MKGYTIEQMTSDEIQLAVEWAAKEGWNPGYNDAQCFYKIDSNGFFAGKLGGEIIVVGSAVNYNHQFAFCGFYITKPEFRHQGYGIQLTHARLHHVGHRITGIDGVLNMTSKYANLGYVHAHNNFRFCCNKKFKSKIAPEIVDIKLISFETLNQFDQQYFPAPRENFLTCWINQPNAITLGCVVDNILLGYGTMRKCYDGYKIGPLFAVTYDVAESLFKALVANAEPPFFIDIPEPNLDALKLVKKFNMSEIFATARMYRNGQPNLDLSGIYGISTLEVG